MHQVVLVLNNHQKQTLHKKNSLTLFLTHQSCGRLWPQEKEVLKEELLKEVLRKEGQQRNLLEELLRDVLRAVQRKLHNAQ